MKNIIYLFLLISNIFFAQTGFKNGNVLYKQGSYQEAIDVYETIIYRSQKQSPELYFNIANCYYKLNKVGPSIYYYEKSLLLNPDFAAANNNLEIAKKLQIDDIKIVEKVGIGKIIQNLTSKLNYDTWAWIAVGFAILFLMFFIGYYFSEKSLIKQLLFSCMLAIFAALLITVSAAIFEKYVSEKDQPAIIFSDVTSLLSAPSTSAKEIMKLHEGVKVYVLENNKTLSKVQLTDGTTGWIDTNAIKAIR